MTSTCSAFIATSLDGFIARPDGDITWLDQANSRVTPGEDCGFSEFMSNIDAIVMGRNTFEKVLSFPEWPYPKTPVIVLSSSINEIPHHLPPNVRLFHDDPASLIQKLAQE